jgi:predicted O-methyltransferase YrrM
MLSLKKYGEPLIRSALKLNAQKAISGLKKELGIYQKMVGDALKEALDNNLTPEEKNWIDKIELLRKELESSAEEIFLTDFGARKIPDPELYDIEIEKGRRVLSTVGAKCKSGSEIYFWVLVLFKLIRKYKPLSCLELGTCMGLSASFQASALRLNGSGKIVTLEGADPLASIAEKNFQILGLNNINIIVGRFQDTLHNVLSEYGPIDYAFLDGHLDGLATIDYFEEIVPFCKNKAMMIIDNIFWSPSMKKAWNQIEADKRTKVTFNLRHFGVCIIDNEKVEKQKYRIPLI